MTDDLDTILAGETIQIWVEGRAVVHHWDDEAKTHADRLTQAATALGMHVFRRPYNVDDETANKHRRWTFRRVSRYDVLSLIQATPGITVDSMVSTLYQEAPWTPERQSHSKIKLRVLLHHLKNQGSVVKRYDANGAEQWVASNVIPVKAKVVT